MYYSCVEVNNQVCAAGNYINDRPFLVHHSVLLWLSSSTVLDHWGKASVGAKLMVAALFLSNQEKAVVVFIHRSPFLLSILKESK